MIKVEKLTHGFPAKDLYNDISFTLEAGQHAVLIGSNGSGKSTLVDMLMNNLVQSTPPVRNQETTVPVKGKP